MDSNHCVVRCENLVRKFKQGDAEVVGLDHVSVAINQGDFVCLSGPSGSGKTTLLNAIGGLDKPDEGSVLLADKQIEKLSKNELASLRLNKIGFVFQAYNLVPVLSAKENVEFVMELQGKVREDREKLSMALLKEVGLQGMEDRRPAQLSGGQQQRVAVARAIVSEPDIVLADEPTANLDSTTAEKLMDLFEELNEKRGITFIISTHDERVMRRAKRLVHMVDGKIESDQSFSAPA